MACTARGVCALSLGDVAIPCHRVVRQGGAPGGYRWGVARERALLAREARARTADAPESPPAPARAQGS